MSFYIPRIPIGENAARDNAICGAALAFAILRVYNMFINFKEIIMFNILVVEDDAELNRLFCTVLRKNGYNPLGAADGEAALEIMASEYVDLIISDIMMPRLDGFQLTQAIRHTDRTVPVLIITAKDSFGDKQKGFLSGADDYMVKPVDVEEMLLRVGALLRRAKFISEHRQTVGSTVLDYDSLTVKQGETETVLPQKEFYLLYKLLSAPGHIFTRQQLMDEIWGMETETEARTVDVHINRLRERFKDNGDFSIVTVRGLGYKAVKN